MKTFLAAVALASLAACAARTAYNTDRSQSWTCIPNPQVAASPIGAEPALTIAEPAASSSAVAKKSGPAPELVPASASK